MRAQLKLLFFYAAKYCGLFHLARRVTRRGLRILCYHGIWMGPGHFGNFLFMQPEKFANRMRLLARSGYPIVSLDEAVTGLASDTLPDCATAVTIDDGWYSSYRHMIPALRAQKLPATIYVTTYYVENQAPNFEIAITYMLTNAKAQLFDLGDLDVTELAGVYDLADPDARETARARISEFGDHDLNRLERANLCYALGDCLGISYQAIIDERLLHLMTLEEIASASEAGIDIQLHTHRHRFPMEDRTTAANEIQDNRAILEAIAGQPLKHFCYPSGIYDPKHLDILKDFEIESATTMDHGLNFPGASPYALSRISDGQKTHQIEFEAELAGFTEILRRVRNHRTVG